MSARIRPASHILTLTLIVATVLVLFWMGREPICKCGYVKLWHGIVISPENSQHLADWYTVTHVVHGFLFFFLAFLLLRHLSFGWRLTAATALECLWEIVENTNAVIERYRTTTVSLDYFGDSIVNSAGDIIAMMFGFWLASRLPAWLSVSLALAAEAFLLWQIRDNLALNILMLIWPLEPILRWQSGG